VGGTGGHIGRLPGCISGEMIVGCFNVLCAVLVNCNSDPGQLDIGQSSVLANFTSVIVDPVTHKYIGLYIYIYIYYRTCLVRAASHI